MRKSPGRLPVLVTAVAMGVSVLVVPPAVAQVAGVVPASVDLTLLPGGTATVTKSVTTPTIPQNPDVVLLADTTGSMSIAISDVRANAGALMADVLAAQPTARFGVAEFKDVVDPVPFRVNQQLTADPLAVRAGITQWVSGGGGDFPEDQINALYRIATGDISFRAGSTRIVAMFGDAPSHNPSAGRTLTETIAALSAANVHVIAVNLGLLDRGGQASAITASTGGVLISGVPASQVSQAILNGIKAIPVTVRPSVTSCTPGLTLGLSPSSVTVPSGRVATFTETVTVAGNAGPGEYSCTVDYLVDGQSLGFTGTTTVRVPGISIADITLTEAGTGTSNAIFTVSLNTPLTTAVSVNYATSDGTATAPADYTATSGTLTFEPGTTTQQIVVPLVGDSLDEATEFFRVTLSNATSALISRAVATATILDGDRDGGFTCMSTAMQLILVTAAVANPANDPCADDTATLSNNTLTSGLLSVRGQVVTASTDITPNDPQTLPSEGDGIVARNEIGALTITSLGAVTVQADGIVTESRVTCVNNAPVYSSSSTVSALRINGVAVTVGTQQLTIPLVIGTLKVNTLETVNGQQVRTALALDTALARVVVGESKAGIKGTTLHPDANPCRA